MNIQKKSSHIRFRHHTVRDGQGDFMITPRPVTQELLNVIADKFVVRDDDVFIVTYPKSGTTWMKQIIHLLANNGEQGDRNLDEFVPYIEGTHQDRIDNPQEFVDILEGINGRRYFVSHLPYTLMPGVSDTQAKYIYVARNPKDCAVSFYHFMLNVVGVETVGAWDEFLGLYLEGNVYYGLVFDHFLAWWQASQRRDNIIFLKYEDLHEDLAHIVQMIVKFIEVPLTPALLGSVIEQSSFSAMKANSKSEQNQILNRYIRKGIVGDWQNHFTSEQNAIFDELCQKKWENTGLDLEFAPHLAQ